MKLLDEEMDSVNKEQREKVEAIEEELNEIRRRMDRLWVVVETTGLEINDILPSIREHQERQERLEAAASEARAILSMRTTGLGDEETIAAYAQDMRRFLKKSELTETKAFVRSFVKEILVVPGDALMRYSVPMPENSMIPGGATFSVALDGAVLPIVENGGSVRVARHREIALCR